MRFFSAAVVILSALIASSIAVPVSAHRCSNSLHKLIPFVLCRYSNPILSRRKKQQGTSTGKQPKPARKSSPCIRILSMVD
ncbi:hypothetical protein BJ322DRAFT_1045344 [Thelephora terrestris]|uniref:Secreted protein n=1 Tax=Thelephora terrestris TaxID=56493 RepID=A0A9P6L8U8_9AGAM|nr:hypothetical protein BJ322DRAFT_1045344 [Thelephora terrestris]